MAMEANFQRALALVLKHEEGFSNHAADPGGATNKGITLETFRRYVKPGGTVADLKAITDSEVVRIYKHQYWTSVKGDRLPSGIDYAVFDFAVNSGSSRAIRTLQRILLVRQDGIIGPQTLSVLERAKPEHVVEVLCAERQKFLKTLPTWPTFGKGWSRRVSDVQANALKMIIDDRMMAASAPVSATPPPVPSKPPVTINNTKAMVAFIATALIGGCALFWENITTLFGG
jgi:lysozyme family protein